MFMYSMYFIYSLHTANFIYSMREKYQLSSYQDLKDLTGSKWPEM